MNEKILEEISAHVQDGNAEETRESVKSALEQGADPLEIVEQGLAKGVRRVGDCFGRGEVFLTQLMMAADAIKAGLDAVQPELTRQGKGPQVLGKVVLGTVKGDIHDLGKNIISTMLQVNGFDVFDLGVDVPPMKFIEKAVDVDADIIAMSALMTTTLPFQADVTKLLSEMGLRPKFKVLIGGAPVTEEWARQIGADAYATDAIPGVEKAKNLVGVHQ